MNFIGPITPMLKKKDYDNKNVEAQLHVNIEITNLLSFTDNVTHNVLETQMYGSRRHRSFNLRLVAELTAGICTILYEGIEFDEISDAGVRVDTGISLSQDSPVPQCINCGKECMKGSLSKRA